ncbi:MAG: hypothetical protein JNJ61_21505 [Anaerolineae bacterium]|nr:hypothetical protein [Anaerolineae bacterium]
MSEHDGLIRALNEADAQARSAAWDALRALDEDAVDALLNAFYAGMSEPHGTLILALVAEIGGPDALTLLRNVYYDPGARQAWHTAAAQGLLHNRANLDAHELAQLERDGE